jgi:hypothetical protein
LQRIGFGNDFLCELEKQFAFPGKPELSLRSIDELRSCLVLKFCDLRADGGL